MDDFNPGDLVPSLRRGMGAGPGNHVSGHQNTEHDPDCACAPCGTLVMAAPPGLPLSTPLPVGTRGRCVFCRTDGPLAYRTRLGHSVGVCCA
ncbi:hypothetical protein [Streptomyces sp. NPDC060001]|uniref:hypothetical protein n=1 Tax=Streptomyces sp. NPDC060001 TaxID=3347032 RepID=UPI003683BA98